MLFLPLTIKTCKLLVFDVDDAGTVKVKLDNALIKV